MESNTQNTYTYFKILATESSSSGWEAYYKKIELFNELDGSLLTKGKAYSSDGSNENASYAFDSREDTKYRTQMDPGKVGDWIIFQTDYPALVNHITIKQYGSECNHVKAIEFYASNDGMNWKLKMKAKNLPLDFFDSDQHLKTGNVETFDCGKSYLEERKKNIEDNSVSLEITKLIGMIFITQGRGNGESTAYMSSKVALIIDKDAGVQFLEGLKPLEKVVTYLGEMADLYEKVVGFVPYSDFNPRQFRVSIAFLENAAGRAGHGSYGIYIGPAFLQETYDKVAQGEKMLHQIFYYETFRNFINPDIFTPAFDYAVNADISNYGWINQGFVNIIGCLICLDIGLGFYYHGQNRQQFRNSMEDMLNAYIDKGETWESCLGKHHLLPWNRYCSIDNIWSGILSVLYDMCGKTPFLIRLFKIIPLIGERRGGRNYDKFNHQSARDNLFIAVSSASLVASANEILSYFNKLKFDISNDAHKWINHNYSLIQNTLK
jgi:hypothetical protein